MNLMTEQEERYLDRKLRFLPLPLQKDLKAFAKLHQAPPGTLLLEEGSYVRAVPLVLEGRLKVYIEENSKRLLLYYIEPQESCVMSFSAVLQGAPSQVVAEVEKETRMLLLPSGRLPNLLRTHTALNQVFFRQYQQRYTDLLQNVEQILFQRLEDRILAYLKKRRSMQQNNRLLLTHRQIALDLGSAREVITRTLGKMEADGLLRTFDDGGLELL